MIDQRIVDEIMENGWELDKDFDNGAKLVFTHPDHPNACIGYVTGMVGAPEMEGLYDEYNKYNIVMSISEQVNYHIQDILKLKKMYPTGCSLIIEMLDSPSTTAMVQLVTDYARSQDLKTAMDDSKQKVVVKALNSIKDTMQDFMKLLEE